MSEIRSNTGFLEAIQGLKGEELTSAVLGYLLVHSPNCYRSFLESLGLDSSEEGQSPTEVATEVETRWDSHDPVRSIPGRLDLLVETGTRLIGVENKIWASFMEHQPLKYCAKLIDESHIRGLRSNPILAVLAPKAKEKSAKQALSQVGEIKQYASIETKIIYWSDLLQRLGAARYETEQISHVSEELRKYIELRIWFSGPFADVFSELNNWDSEWNQSQKQLVSYLWYLFPSQGQRLNCTNRWLGYSFLTDRDDVWGWFGFVRPQTELLAYDRLSRSNGAEFVLNFWREGQAPNRPGNAFIDVEFNQRSWKDQGWLVDIDADWSTFLDWANNLSEAISAIGAAED